MTNMLFTFKTIVVNIFLNYRWDQSQIKAEEENNDICLIM